MKYVKRGLRHGLALVAALLLLGNTLAVPAQGLNIYASWPRLSNGAVPTFDNYITVKSVTASEYPDAGNLFPMFEDSGDQYALIKVITIPGLEAPAGREQYNLTLTLSYRDGKTGQILTLHLETENYYLPVRCTLTAADGRQCPIYLVAIPENRDYSGADFSAAAEQNYGLAQEAMELYETLSAAKTGVAGGYHIESGNALSIICRSFSSIGFLFNEDYLGMHTREECIEYAAGKLKNQGYLDPTQAAYCMSDVFPWYMEYCRQPIPDPELLGARVFGAEAVKTGDTQFTINLPDGIDWSKAQSALELELPSSCICETIGNWSSGTAILLTVTARDPATAVIYNTDTYGKVQGSYVLQLETGDPFYALHSFQVQDRSATIDEETNTISLHLAQGWSWEQAPAVTASGTSYAYLDEKGDVLTPGGDGAVDLSKAKTLRLTLDLSDYAANGAVADALVYTKDYALQITQGDSDACDLLSFSLGIEGEQVEWGNDNTITVTIPYATDWGDLNPTYTASYDAVVTGPDAPDFEHSEQTPVVYRVTAEDGTTAKDYHVVVKKTAPATGKEILSFRYGSQEGTINDGDGTVTLELPAGSSTRFAPTIVVSEFATVEPASGVVQDFSSPVTYTVTAQDGAQKRYIVTVSVSGEQQENPQKARMESLLNRIIQDYRTSANDDWEWLNLGIYDGLDTPNSADGFDVAREIAQMNLSPTSGIMTDIDRVVMMLTARGYDCSNLAQYNGGEPFYDGYGNQIDNLIDNLCEAKSSINGYIFGLIALDMGNYSVPEGVTNSREAMLDYLLDIPAHYMENSIMGLDGLPMTMYALAPYQDDPVYGERVQAKVDEYMERLLAHMNPDYTFESAGTVNSEILSQTICALSAWGIDANTDPRFGNGEMSILTQWLDLYAMSNGFKHVSDERAPNDLATYEGCYALQWYLGFLENGGNGHPYYLWYHVQDFSRTFSTAANILSFELEGRQGVITEGNGTGENTIVLTLPTGTPLTQVSPHLTLSDGATLVAPALPTTLTAGVRYPFTVRAEDGVTEKTYYVTVEFSDAIQPSGAELYLDTIQLQDANQRDLAILNSEVTQTESGADILLTVEAGKDTSSLRMTANISFGAAASPALDGTVELDLSDWTVFTVTSADGLHQKTYRVKVQSMNQAAISAFSLTINRTTYQGQIDNTANTIIVADVDDSNLTSTRLVPDITLAEGTTVCNPLPGTPQDFSAPVTYTVSGSDVVSRAYTVRVTNRSGSLISSSGGGSSTSSSATITAFSVLGVDGTIDQSAGTIIVRLPYGTNVSAVIPTVTVPAGATVSPVFGEVVNLNSVVPYTVTLGTESKTYYVSVIFVRTTSQQLWDDLAGETTVRDHQVSRDPNGLPGGWRYHR